MSPKSKRYFYNTLGVLLSLLFIYFCYYSLQHENLSAVFQVQHPFFLLWIIPFNFIVMGVRAYKWQILLRPIHKLPYWTLFDILNLGYMANNLLPLKAGEFFRASLVAKKWKLPYTQVLTTIGLERYFSGIALFLMLFFVSFFLQIPGWIKSGAYIVATILLVVQVCLWILWVRKPNLEKWEKRHPVFYHSIKTLYHIGEGSAVLKKVLPFLSLVGIALIAWCGQVFMIKIIEWAYGIHIPWTASMFVVVAINLAIALPSAPGNLGTFEFAAILAYSFVGVDKAMGLGIGIFFHFLQVIPTTLVGLFYYWRWGIRFKDMEREAEQGLEKAIG